MRRETNTKNASKKQFSQGNWVHSVRTISIHGKQEPICWRQSKKEAPSRDSSDQEVHEYVPTIVCHVPFWCHYDHSSVTEPLIGHISIWGTIFTSRIHTGNDPKLIFHVPIRIYNTAQCVVNAFPLGEGLYFGGPTGTYHISDLVGLRLDSRLVKIQACCCDELLAIPVTIGGKQEQGTNTKLQKQAHTLRAPLFDEVVGSLEHRVEVIVARVEVHRT